MSSALILPAAGFATRLGGIPKFLLPDDGGSPLIQRHVGGAASVDEILVLTRPKLAAFLQELLGSRVRVSGVETGTMAETVLVGLELLPDASGIAIGLPDTVTSPPVPYGTLIEGLSADAMTVAAYPTRPDQAGRLGAIRSQGTTCIEIRDKDPSTIGNPSWSMHWGAIAFQRSVLTEFLDSRDPHVGYALESATARGLAARIAHIGSSYFDLGTPAEVARYYSSLATPDVPE